MAANEQFSVYLALLLLGLCFYQAKGKSSSLITSSESVTASTSTAETVSATKAPTPTTATSNTATATSYAAQNSMTTAGPSPSTTQVITPTPTTTSSASSTATVKPTPDPNATTIVIEGSFKTTNMVYNKSLANASSPQFKGVQDKLRNAFRSIMPSGINLTLKSLRSGSVIIDFRVTYLARKDVDVSTSLGRAIRSGKLGDFVVDPKSLNITIKIPGCTLEKWKVDDESYKGHCCKSTIGFFTIKQKGSGKCSDVELKKVEDCGDAKDPPPCQGCSTNVSTALIMLGLVASKIFL